MTNGDKPGKQGTPTQREPVKRAFSVNDALAFAMERHQNGKLAEAERIYRQVLSKLPDHTEALHLLGVLLHQTEQLDDALGLIQRAIERMPGEPRYHQSLARIWLDRGAYGEAAQSLQRAVDFGEETEETLNNLAVCLYQLDRFDEAVTVGRRATKMFPKSLELYINLGNALRDAGALEEAVGSYLRALELAPQTTPALSALGSTFMLLGMNDRALEYFQQALEIDPTDVDATRGTQQLNARLVPRWHFPMLNDEHRNRAFDEAISKVAKPGAVVLDIGTGTGLLAMMAARAGAETVVACEAVGSIAEVAGRIVETNGMADRVTVIPKRSTELRVSADLPRRADVVIAEILDAGLLGEGVLPVLRHARQHLAAPDAAFIPRAATVIGMLVESTELVAREWVGSAGGFDLRQFNEFSLPQYAQRRLRNFNHRALSEPFEIFRFDFVSEVPLRSEQELLVDATKSGDCHAVAFWFQLHLDDEIALDTGPSSQSSHWQQAVQLVDPTSISAGETIQVAATYDVDTVRFEMR